MNQLFASLGLSAWKPWFTVLLLPPVPFLIVILIGARLILPRRGLGWTMVASGVTATWLSGCLGMAYWLDDAVLSVPPAAGPDRIAEWTARERARHDTAIIVLGSGREAMAPEYGVASLSRDSLERLRYGLWLGRRTGIPVGFSGGTGWAQDDDGAPEADIAAHIAADEFGHPLRWAEGESRDTRENALRSLALLGGAHVNHVILVSNAWHVPRALRNFQRAAAGLHAVVQIDVAPIGLARERHPRSLLWMPSSAGIDHVRATWRELIGLWMGA